MPILATKSIAKNGGVKRNSYYDIERKPYTGIELDAYRISEGYSKERKTFFNIRKYMEDKQ